MGLELPDAHPDLNSLGADHAIFLDPREDSKLADILCQYCQTGPLGTLISHLELTDRKFTPVAIGIVTKSRNLEGSSDAATLVKMERWLRVQFEHFASLPNATSNPPPMIPVLLVRGPSWYVDFARWTEDHLV